MNRSAISTAAAAATDDEATAPELALALLHAQALHLRDGKPLPEGAALGPDGSPTTDPQTALEGAQLTFGGHKGTAIALMVELLAAALTGSPFGYEARRSDGDGTSTTPTMHGEFNAFSRLLNGRHRTAT